MVFYTGILTDTTRINDTSLQLRAGCNGMFNGFYTQTDLHIHMVSRKEVLRSIASHSVVIHIMEL